MKYLNRHHAYYLLVVSTLTLCFVAVRTVGYTRQLQVLFVLTAAFLYVLMGVIHHKVEHDLHLRIILEYVGIASLGMAIIYFLIQVQ